MANEISLVTASGRTVTPKDDGIIYEVFSPGNGIIYGGAVTIKDSSTLHITAGHGIVCGRKFTIDDSDIPVSLSGSGSLLGRLYIHLDLADAADPITLLVETGASLTPVVQDADVNINNGVYEINIATFDVDTSTISNLVNLDVTVAPMGDMEGATAGTDGKGGYVPAPQAGDEDKVLRGDGTWGSAGDASTVRYVPSTDKVQLWDGSDWVNWKTAGLLTPIQLIPLMTSNTSPSGRASFICENYGSRDYFTGTKNNVNVTSANVRLATIQNYAYLGFINTEPYPSTASYITCGGGEEGEGTTWGVQYEFDDIRTIKYMTVGTWSYGSTASNTGRATFRIYTRDATTNIWTARYTNDVTTSAADGGYNNGYSIVGNIAIDTENVNGIKVVMENIRCRNSYVGDIRAFGY